MRVVAHLTIDGVREVILEGDSATFDKGFEPEGSLDQVGFWLDKWCYNTESGKGAHHKGRVFCPWTSVLFVEESSEGS